MKEKKKGRRKKGRKVESKVGKKVTNKVWKIEITTEVKGGFQSNHEMVKFNMKSRVKKIKRWIDDLEEIQRECF